MKKILIISLSFCLLTLFCANGFAQDPAGFITGQVTERTTGQPLAGVKISVANKADTTTDEDGNFRLEIAPGVYDVEISRADFAPVSKSQIAVTGGRVFLLNIQLDVALSENVEVRSDVFTDNAEQTTSNSTLNRAEIRTTPGSGGDPLRVINALPGVISASGEFADLLVRGGTAEENLTFIDNIPAGDFTYFTDRFDGNRGGRASILAPDVFETLEFSAGGFGVRYGDRLSSVLDIHLREANRKRVQTVIFVDSGTAGGSLDVPLGEKGSWLFSARRSFIGTAFKVAGIVNDGIIGFPTTLDFTNKVIYDLTPRNKISFTLLNLFDSFDQDELQAIGIDRRTDRFETRRTSRRLVFGSTLSSTIGEKTLAQTTFWINGAHNDGTFIRPNFFDENPVRVPQRYRDLRDSQFGIKEELTSSLSRKVKIAVGGGLIFDQANYFTFENSGSFFSPLEEEFNAVPRENRLQLDTTASAYGYAQATINITPRFSVTPGIRIDRYGITGETLASPRIGARYGINSRVALTFAAGIYRQPPGLFVLSLTPNNRSLKAESASHVIGGIEWLVREDLKVRFEAYQKNYEDLIVQPVRTSQNFALDGNHFNSGSGTAKGLEISVQKALTGFFSAQASYGFIRSRRKFTADGIEFPSDFERPHQLTLIGISRFYGFTVAAKYRLASGLPYTRRTPIDVLPPFQAFIQRIAQESDTNALRLPNFASFDLRVEKRFGFRRWSFSPYIDIFNLTENNSIVQPNYELFEQEAGFLNEGRRLPIFGLRIEF